jgi:hypothetical protein
VVLVNVVAGLATLAFSLNVAAPEGSERSIWSLVLEYMRSAIPSEADYRAKWRL